MSLALGVYSDFAENDSGDAGAPYLLDFDLEYLLKIYSDFDDLQDLMDLEDFTDSGDPGAFL